MPNPASGTPSLLAAFQQAMEFENVMEEIAPGSRAVGVPIVVNDGLVALVGRVDIEVDGMVRWRRVEMGAQLNAVGIGPETLESHF